MTILTADLKLRLSTASGAAGNTLASTPAASLGKYISTTDLVDNSLGNLFAAITGTQAAEGRTVYRCLFVLNNHVSETWANVKVWLVSQLSGGGDIALGLDPAGVTAKGSAPAQAATIASETAAPAGVTFSAPASVGAGLSVGSVAAGSCFAIWFRLKVPTGAGAVSADQAIFECRET